MDLIKSIFIVRLVPTWSHAQSRSSTSLLFVLQDIKKIRKSWLFCMFTPSGSRCFCGIGKLYFVMLEWRPNVLINTHTACEFLLYFQPSASSISKALQNIIFNEKLFCLQHCSVWRSPGNVLEMQAHMSWQRLRLGIYVFTSMDNDYFELITLRR